MSQGAQPTIDIPDVRILRRLQGGTTAVVYRGHDRILDVPVAVKVIFVGASRSARLEVLREARTLVRLRHPNLVSVYRAGMADNCVYTVMDYIGGETLEQYVTKRGPAEPHWAVATAAKILDTLAFLHRQIPPVIHMDVSPVNVMIDRTDGEPRLMDFGTSVSKHRVKPYTPHFSSPERIGNRAADPAMDVYSAGAVLRYLLTGRVEPIEGGSAGLEHMFCGDLVQLMTATDPAKRPGAAQAAALLRARLNGGGARGFPWVFAAIGAGVLMLLAGAGLAAAILAFLFR